MKTALIGFGLIIIMIPAKTYLIDAFTLYFASVITGKRVLISFIKALFPLVGPPLYARISLS